jgi:hypothetical protein
MKLAGKVVNANNHSMSEKKPPTTTLVQFVEGYLTADGILSTVEAWHTLVGEGCEPSTLICHLCSCIQPNPELNRVLSDNSIEFRGHRKRVKRLARRMRTIADEYRALKQEPTFGAVITDVNHVGPALEVLLDYQAECLDTNTASYLKKKSRHFLTEDMPLVALSAYVVGVTQQKHYPELAALLAAWSGLKGKRQDFFPDNLSKKVRRFEQKFGKLAFERLVTLQTANRTKTAM